MIGGPGLGLAVEEGQLRAPSRGDEAAGAGTFHEDGYIKSGIPPQCIAAGSYAQLRRSTRLPPLLP